MSNAVQGLMNIGRSIGQEARSIPLREARSIPVRETATIPVREAPSVPLRQAPSVPVRPATLPQGGSPVVDIPAELLPPLIEAIR